MRAQQWKALRHYWSVVVFVAVAAVLVAAGAPARAALAGAGFALFGAALTRGIDIAIERAASRQRDLDETRRLAYVALHAGKSRNAHLIATLVNALAYHQSADDPETVVEHVTAVIDGRQSDNAEDVRWLNEQIDRINRETGDAQDDQDR